VGVVGHQVIDVEAFTEEHLTAEAALLAFRDEDLIAFGRLLWLLFAHQLSAVADPAVPVLSVAAVVVGTLLIANLVAALPGRIASRTPAALVLRSE
jgi:hypothetical protein